MNGWSKVGWPKVGWTTCVLNNIINLKFEPKLNFNILILFLKLQLFLSGLIDKGQDDYIEFFFNLFQLIVLETMRNLLAFFIFFNIQ